MLAARNAIVIAIASGVAAGWNSNESYPFTLTGNITGGLPTFGPPDLSLTVDKNGKAKGAIYFDKDGNTHEVKAKVVVVCCNGIGTPRLLLNSKSNLFPDGLGNTHGLVGKNFMGHPVLFIKGVFDEIMDSHIGPMGSPLYSHEFFRKVPFLQETMLKENLPSTMGPVVLVFPDVYVSLALKLYICR